MSAFSWASLRFCRWGCSRVVGPAGEVPACWRGSTLLVQPAVAFGRVSLIGCPSLERDPFTLNKSECSKQALRRSNGSAWNNRRGPASASVGLTEAGNDQEGRMGTEVWHGERCRKHLSKLFPLIKNKMSPSSNFEIFPSKNRYPFSRCFGQI